MVQSTIYEADNCKIGQVSRINNDSISQKKKGSGKLEKPVEFSKFQKCIHIKYT